MADGRRLKADLIVAGRRRQFEDPRFPRSCSPSASYLPDGAIRMLIDKTPEEMASGDGGTTIENWSGSRRILYTPVSETEVYIALDHAAFRRGRTARADRQAPTGSEAFPHLVRPDRPASSTTARYGRFEYIRLKSWSSGRVAMLGDAAHALPPNIGQGAGCSMMNGLSLAYYLDREKDMATALKTWETNERPMTEHTQRISVFLGLPTHMADAAAARIPYAGRQVEMDGRAAHQDRAPCAAEAYFSSP